MLPQNIPLSRRNFIATPHLLSFCEITVWNQIQMIFPSLTLISYPRWVCPLVHSASTSMRSFLGCNVHFIYSQALTVRLGFCSVRALRTTVSSTGCLAASRDGPPHWWVSLCFCLTSPDGHSTPIWPKKFHTMIIQENWHSRFSKKLTTDLLSLGTYVPAPKFCRELESALSSGLGTESYDVSISQVRKASSPRSGMLDQK